MRKKT